ncbi:MAG: flagellar basal body rod protein FlgB [Gammaproteobacteria bacterium]|nr:flagellar basal body rod protein FlgB [Gammaproteobacteria bacterium]
MPISFERAFSIHDDAMILRARRSSILASNIANTDTPDYKARDIDFRSVLRSVEKPTVGDKLRLAATHRSHLSARGFGNDATLQYRNPLHASLDGNTVDSHVEQARFSENAIQYQTSYTFLNGRIQGVINALKGD